MKASAHELFMINLNLSVCCVVLDDELSCF